jgi:hypothetical protein
MRTELQALAMALDPSLVLEALGHDPDPWQRDYLRSRAERILLMAYRQSGKSTATSALAIHTAVFDPGSLVLLLSPSLRQSGLLFHKVVDGYAALGRPVPIEEDNATTLALANGSRVVCLPGSPATIRGYSGPRLVVVDEAAMARDDLFVAVAPMLAVSRGRLALLSTPLGKRGFFHGQWADPASPWEKFKVTAEGIGRIDPAFLAEQRRVLGERWYRQEFLCSFEETVDQVFSTDSILGAFSAEVPPLFGG